MLPTIINTYRSVRSIFLYLIIYYTDADLFDADVFLVSFPL